MPNSTLLRISDLRCGLRRSFYRWHGIPGAGHPRGEFFHIDWPDAARPQLKLSELGMNRS